MLLSTVSILCLYLAAGAYVLSFVAFALRKEQMTDVCFYAGFLFHTTSQLSRGWFIGVFTPHAMFEGVFFFPWCLAFLTICLRFIKNDTRLINSTLIPILLFLLFTVLYPKGIIPPSPQLQTVFSSLFFIFEVLAQACFCLAAWFALRYLYHRKEAAFFDSIAIWGFILYSIAQVVGAVWCYLGWASLFSWSERHLQSASVWCFYAAYIHLRFIPLFDMGKKAWFSVAGFIFVLVFTFLSHFREMRMPRLGG
jgi:ABC-type transport system involved in cytochrome c biogenesis permease subunit